MWKTINKLTNKQSKTTLISKIRNDNQNLTKKHEIADVLIHISTKLHPAWLHATELKDA